MVSRVDRLAIQVTQGKCNRLVPWRNRGRLSMMVEAELLLRREPWGQLERPDRSRSIGAKAGS